MRPVWYVVETSCYPCSWKVTSDKYRQHNMYFFRTEEEAVAFADRLNKTETWLFK